MRVYACGGFVFSVCVHVSHLCRVVLLPRPLLLLLLSVCVCVCVPAHPHVR
ncbi:hypothetical protein, conserved [Leishmania donovani]|uniref:Uncharacterized protein n=1 Tax=Leishmania donovani TaxID=5661 RepID=E9BGV5_LEIDO|nr:hypothetical protein, conserved [Leishmania donovani]CBZ34481.1 hypothetical protein, conserved [Leishmania donovani]